MMSPITPDPFPTRKSLLTRLKNWDDQESWREFFDTYWRLIHKTALEAGLTEAEAEEVVQETILTVAKRFREGKMQHDPQLGSFKGWLLKTTRWRIEDQFRKRFRELQVRRARVSEGDPRKTPTTERIPDPAGLESVWERDWEATLMEAAMERVKRRVDPRLFQLFHTHVVREWPAKKVAQKLQVKLMKVYYAKHKIGGLVRQEVRRLQDKGI